jgi:hypothetical protein
VTVMVRRGRRGALARDVRRPCRQAVAAVLHAGPGVGVRRGGVFAEFGRAVVELDRAIPSG